MSTDSISRYMDCITYQLNPIRSGTVKDMKLLDRYAYAGHSRVVGKRISPWQDVDSILRRFGRGKDAARRRYRDFISQGIGQGQRPELVGGGLLRSVGGWSVLTSMRRMNLHLKGDERILGDSDFVEAVLSRASEQMEDRYGRRPRAGPSGASSSTRRKSSVWIGS